MTKRILVAGIGNIFLGDDAFGVEVVGHLLGREMPDGVEVQDYGIRGVHLAYQLMEGYDTLILIDAVERQAEPGDLFIIEPDVDKPLAEISRAVQDGSMPLVDSHGMAPGAMLATLDKLGGAVERVLVVGCQPQDVSERMGLSSVVEASVPRAVEMVMEVVMQESQVAAVQASKEESGA